MTCTDGVVGTCNGGEQPRRLVVVKYLVA